MITKDQAISSNMFHYQHREGEKPQQWRRNGKTQTWKTRPEDYVVPVKFGLWDYYHITPSVADNFHTAEDCPNS